MKKIFATVAFAAIFAACNSNTKTAEQTTVQPDTSGLAKFQEWKQQQEFAEQSQLLNGVNDPDNVNNLAPVEPTNTIVREKVVYRDRPAPRRTSTRASTSGSGTNNGSVATAPAPAKKGWSKAAKGTAIGAGSGAVVGAVISKNKAAGAIIGGVVGGVGGYVIGRSKDKKDGRVQ